METYTLSGSQDPISGEYRQVLHWTISGNLSRSIGMYLLSIPVFLIFTILFFFLAFRWGRWDGDFTLGILEAVILVAASVLTIVLHELIHALFMRLFGARPRFGVLWKLGAVYATSPGYGYRRNSYLLIALAPLVLISLLAVLVIVLLPGSQWVPLVVICAILNGSGASGDLWITSIVLRYPKTAYIVDEKDGIRILVRSEA
jgi:hypothetical protein